MGIHSIDIETVRQPNGNYQVFSCVLWAECGKGETSHYTNAGFTIDVQTECIAQKLHQYAVAFNKSGHENYVGRRMANIQKACKTAVDAHRSLNKVHPWANGVGWDCAFTDKQDQIVFFEGNLAVARVPRMIFVNQDNLKDFICDFAWPFKSSRSLHA